MKANDRELENIHMDIRETRDVVKDLHKKVDCIDKSLAKICEYVETQKEKEKQLHIKSGVLAAIISTVIGIIAKVWHT